MKNILGCDIGNVIVAHDTDTNAFNNNNLEKPPIDGAFASLLDCAPLFDNLYIVSKCGERRQSGTLNWFLYQDFYDKTGVQPKNVLFCRKRQDKAVICRDLGITHFIDDRLEILSYIYDVNPSMHLYLFNEQPYEFNKWKHKLQPTMKRFNRWADLLAQLRRDV